MRTLPLLLTMAALALTACGQTPAQTANTRLKVVASTSIVADVVHQIGGDMIELRTLVPIGVDAHSFTPAPQDAAMISEAQAIFISGAGYEAFMQPLLQSAGGRAELVELAQGLALRPLSEQELATEADHADEQHADEQHDHEGQDPHIWMDPNNVRSWAATIGATLGRLDPANAEAYSANARAYDAQLGELDTWIRDQIASIPPDQRMLVTDHAVFGYLADRYGFTQVGVIVPGGSSIAEASAQDLAALQDQVRSLGVRAIFVGDVASPELARRLSEDTGTKLVTVLTESLTRPDGPGASYIDFMRFNVSTIAGALRP